MAIFRCDSERPYDLQLSRTVAMCLNETGAVSAVSAQASGLNLHMGSLESIMPWDHASSGTPLPEHLP
jgi:hypothetical protein